MPFDRDSPVPKRGHPPRGTININSTMNCFSKLTFLTFGVLSALTAAQAADTTQVKKDMVLQKENPSLSEWLSNWNKLYKADKEQNPIIQEFNASLRMQYQLGWVDPTGGNVSTKGGAHQDEWRRFRLGLNAKMFNGKLKLVNVWNVGGVTSQREPDKNGNWHHGSTETSLYELYAEYKADPVAISLGKIKPAFTSEYRTSSSAIITVERSVLVNQLRSETNYGIQVNNSDKKDKVGWLLGTYLNGNGSDRRDEPEFNKDDNAFIMGQLSYDTSGFVADKGRIWLDYVHNFSDYTGKKKSANYQGVGAEDIVALSWDLNQDKFSFVAELMGGFNIVDNNDPKASDGVWGFVLMPSYKFTPNWEGVFRYQYANGDRAIKTEKRYITSLTDAASKADSLNAFYVGVNYYVFEENPNMMKIMAGAEYSNYQASGSNGFKGWSYYISLRTNF